MKLNFRNKFDKELSGFPFVIIDVGARGDLLKEWKPIKKHSRFICFEPAEEEFSRLKANAPEENITYINSACYNEKQKIVIHMTQDEGLSSVLMPNYDYLRHFPSKISSKYRITRQIPIDADRIDNMIPREKGMAVDFFKIDVEGVAFQVLEGAERILGEGLVLGLLIEAEFNEKYKNENLFSDVDRLLRKHGYQLFNVETCCWKRSIKTPGIKGQLNHWDFLYFMDIDKFFEKIKDFNRTEREAKIIKFIIISYLYGCYDFSFELLDESYRIGFLDKSHYEVMQKEFKKNCGLLMHMPRLKGHGLFFDLLYHGYMAICGVWLERWGFYTPDIEL